MINLRQPLVLLVLLLGAACRQGAVGGGTGGAVNPAGSGGDTGAGPGGSGGLGGLGGSGGSGGFSGSGGAEVGPPVDAGALIERIGFGSCVEIAKAQTFWTHIVERQPQVFLFLGDVPYLDFGDTLAQLGALAGFKQLLGIARPLVIWDDHDYGLNNGGAAFTGKVASKKRFIDFWGPLGAVAADSPRRTREGNYDAVVMGPVGRQVQVILLDVRYFKGVAPMGTMLGAAQWQWLADELRRPAQLRIIVSGMAAIGSAVSGEGWAQHPTEQQNLYDVIKTSQAKGVVIFSGDKHYAEISRRDVGLGYPLYDFTSSALNANNSYVPAANVYRDTPTATTQLHNFGFATINWTAADRPLQIQIVNAVTGAVLMTRDLTLASLGSL